VASVPTLDTPRLRLRGHRASDLDAAVELWGEPRVYRYITGSPLSEQDVWLRLLRYSGLWDFLGYGYWAVESRSDGRYLGQLGFADFRRGLVGFDGRFPEAGWVLDASVAGRGLATEGMQAACRWLDEQGLHPRTFCVIDPANGASLRVAEKLGYRYLMASRLGDERVGVYLRDLAQHGHQEQR
jgi:RimJ/RimL family protein N-acetyltransferase